MNLQKLIVVLNISTVLSCFSTVLYRHLPPALLQASSMPFELKSFPIPAMSRRVEIVKVYPPFLQGWKLIFCIQDETQKINIILVGAYE
jgi:hypothetical protein